MTIDYNKLYFYFRDESFSKTIEEVRKDLRERFGIVSENDLDVEQRRLHLSDDRDNAINHAKEQQWKVEK